MTAHTETLLLAALKRLTKDIKPGDLTHYHDDWKTALEAIAAAEAAAAAPAPIVAIVIEGGMISDVVTNRPELFAGVELLSIDYDTDGNYDTHTGDCVDVPQSDGSSVPAAVSEWPWDRAKIDLAAVSAALDAKLEAGEETRQ